MLQDVLYKLTFLCGTFSTTDIREINKPVNRMISVNFVIKDLTEILNFS